MAEGQIPFDPDEIVDAIFDSVADIMREDATRVTTALVLASPVGDPSIWQNPASAPPGYEGGHMVRNWQVTLGAQTDAEIEGIDPARSPTIGAARVVIAGYDGTRVRRNDAVYVQNNVPYANRINDGHSRQTPAGFVEMAVQAATQPCPREVV